MAELNHIAIIMDGNGRWAKQRNLPRTFGHKEGAKKVSEILQWAKKYNIKYLTLYAFSTENWKRPQEEVDALMVLLKEFLTQKSQELIDNNICLKIAGRVNELTPELQNLINSTIEETASNTAGTLVIALNYGGRAEITDAAKKIAEKVKNGELQLEDITEETISLNLYNSEIPDPDLLIRTGGELRISNFLLWEIAYTELFITEELWPDFDEKTLKNAIDSFSKRERRKGGLL
jgi:undecaprenyl diphosphate synthase